MNSRPNIIFIVADDLGYADLGCYGGRDAAFGPVSPNLDRLAGNGLRLTQGYSNSPVCSPTRFALLTARYQYHIRGALEEPITPASAKNSELGLPPEHPTLPSMLKKAGYRTALFGKWHLGYPPRFGPILSGYEEFLGPLGGAIDYFTHCDPTGEHDLWVGAERSRQEGYLTDLLTAKAVEYVERRASQRAPFFMSVHYTAPHWPWETRDDAAVAEDVKSNLFHLHGGSVSIYQRMIHHMDEGIGKLVHTLEQRGLARDTLIIFTSDNGGERFSDNWPLVGGKMDLTEGGIRVPWIAQWPAVIPAGSVSHQLCMTMDWSATVLDLAAAVPEGGYPLDGVSLLHVLRDPAHSFPRDLFWRMNYRSQRAYRQGEWKYLRVDDNDYLFNLTNDERERVNLGPRMPERLQSMREMWGRWNASIPVIPQDATVTLGFSEKDMPQR